MGCIRTEEIGDTPEKNVWEFAKARCDAETFWYRGNRSIDGVVNGAFDASKDRDRRVILYGSAQTSGMTALPFRFTAGRPY